MSKLRHLRPAQPVDLIAITWNPFTDTYTAHCPSCADGITGGCTSAHTWADTHVCDPELSVLLAVLDQRAA